MRASFTIDSFARRTADLGLALRSPRSGGSPSLIRCTFRWAGANSPAPSRFRRQFFARILPTQITGRRHRWNTGAPERAPPDGLSFSLVEGNWATLGARPAGEEQGLPPAISTLTHRDLLVRCHCSAFDSGRLATH